VVVERNGEEKVRVRQSLCLIDEIRVKIISVKKLPIVYDAHYSINELMKDVACLRTSDLRTCNTSLNDTDQLSLKIEPNRIEASGWYSFFIVAVIDNHTPII
jgi:hypothetical protein